MASLFPSREETLYARHCAGCHGAKGKGDGAAAAFLYPRPRDFTRGEFKFGSSPADVERAIGKGMPGTSMPPFEGVLSAEERRLLARYVLDFIPRKREAAASGEEEPTWPKPLLGDADRGEALFRRNCALCHGPGGRGDGPSAAHLVDSSGIPLRPPDLVRAPLKGGEDLLSLYRRVTEGIPGTPMPAFAEALSEQERWDLVAYLKRLRQGVERKEDPRLLPLHALAQVPPDPDHPDWKRLPAVELSLTHLWKGAGAKRLRVRAARSKGETGFLLEWEDPHRDVSLSRPEDFLDQAGVMLPEDPGEVPFYGMGGAAAGVRIWHWRALLEPPFGEGEVIRDAASWEETLFPRPAAAAGNLNQADAAPLGHVREYEAAGPGTLTALPRDGSGLSGGGVWRNGWWRVALVKATRVGEGTVAAFAVWDGSDRDRNGRKSVTPWILLGREP